MTTGAARTSRFFPILSVVLAVCLGATALAAEPTFRFDPPDGTTCVATVTTNYVTDFAGTRRITRTGILAERAELSEAEAGYTIAVTVVSADMSGSVGDFEKAFLEAFKDVRLTYHVDPDLTITRVSGVRSAAEGLRESFPEELAAMVEKVLSEEVLLAGMRADWQRDVLNLVGRPAVVGSAWMAEEALPLPSGEMAVFHVAMKVTGEERMGGKPVLRVEFRYDSDPQELAAFLGEKAESLLADKVPVAGEATVTGSGYRLVDPATLLTYGQKRRLTIDTTMTIPERGTFAVSISRDKTYRYDYSR